MYAPSAKLIQRCITTAMLTVNLAVIQAAIATKSTLINPSESSYDILSLTDEVRLRQLKRLRIHLVG